MLHFSNDGCYGWIKLGPFQFTWLWSVGRFQQGDERTWSWKYHPDSSHGHVHDPEETNETDEEDETIGNDEPWKQFVRVKKKFNEK